MDSASSCRSSASSYWNRANSWDVGHDCSSVLVQEGAQRLAGVAALPGGLFHLHRLALAAGNQFRKFFKRHIVPPQDILPRDKPHIAPKLDRDTLACACKIFDFFTVHGMPNINKNRQLTLNASHIQVPTILGILPQNSSCESFSFLLICITMSLPPSIKGSRINKEKIPSRSG